MMSGSLLRGLRLLPARPAVSRGWGGGGLGPGSWQGSWRDGKPPSGTGGRSAGPIRRGEGGSGPNAAGGGR